MLSVAQENIKRVVKKTPKNHQPKTKTSRLRCVGMIIGSSCTGVRRCFLLLHVLQLWQPASLGEGRVVHNPLLFLSCLAQLSSLHFMSYNPYFSRLIKSGI